MIDLMTKKEMAMKKLNIYTEHLRNNSVYFYFGGIHELDSYISSYTP